MNTDLLHHQVFQYTIFMLKTGKIGKENGKHFLSDIITLMTE